MKVLAIANGFSKDATRYIHQTAKSDEQAAQSKLKIVRKTVAML